MQILIAVLGWGLRVCISKMETQLEVKGKNDKELYELEL